MDEIKNFVENLAEFPESELVNTINIYSYNDKNNDVRRYNLTLYLETMKSLNPKIALVGIAPGFYGCRFTGIPFTSEDILFNNKYRFFKNNNYKKTMSLNWEKTAQIMWDELNKFNDIPLLWNAFPFHPHKDKDLTKNRTPNSDERKIGLRFLNDLFSIFTNLDKNRVGAVGRFPQESIDKLNKQKQLRFIPNYIPHPSRRKNQFIKGLNKFLEGN